VQLTCGSTRTKYINSRRLIKNMVVHYTVKAIIEPKHKLNVKAVEGLIKKIYAEVKVLKIEYHGKLIEITYKFIVGPQIDVKNGFSQSIDLFDLNILLKSIDIIEMIEIEHQDYFKYLAYKQSRKEKPLDHQEFLRRINDGEYYKDL